MGSETERRRVGGRGGFAGDGVVSGTKNSGDWRFEDALRKDSGEEAGRVPGDLTGSEQQRRRAWAESGVGLGD